ncbi:hypothetical protein BGZ63DRAFT_466245 [Mariannaea sp. PMI_226]|nr:hypothetical protein BGZ63DRAFT_466245 [Mariannaea sp. PMI_226]
MAPLGSVPEIVIAPPDYFVMNSPNPRENLKFSCPYECCDGWVFFTSEECLAHERDWHTGPYQCAECSTKFAAASALRRHAQASSHGIEWVSHAVEVVEQEMAEAEAEKRAQQNLCHTPAEISFEDIVYADSSRPRTRSLTKAKQTPRKSDQYVCKEPCCRKHRHDYKCKSEWDRHVEALNHRSAVIFGECLRNHLTEGEVLDAEQDAIRGFWCNSKGCADFDLRFSSIKGFFNHLSQPEHLDVTDEKVKEALLEALDKTDFNLKCKQLGCPRYGYAFSSTCSFNLHLASKRHREAQEMATSTPTTELVETPGSYTASFLSPMTPSEMANVISPSSPSAGRDQTQGNALKKILRRPSVGKRREDELLKRNTELEARVQKLEEELSEIRSVLDLVKGLGLK